MSTRVKALEMAFETSERKRTGEPAPFALCPIDGTPLISTFVWSHYEFYCLQCGGHFDWLSPRKGKPTAELEERFAQVEAEWKQLGGEDLLGGGVMLDGCATCRQKREPHLSHATLQEIAAHEAALVKLKERAAA